MKKTYFKLITAALVFLFANPAFAIIEQKSKVSSNDTTAGYLNGKLVAGTGITFTENNDGGNETLTIENGLGTANGAAEFLYIEGASANTFEQILGSDDPTADRSFNFPDDDIAANDVLVGDGAGSLAYLGLATTQILIGDGAGAPTAAALSGDVTMTNAGVVSIAANAAALGTDTTGNYAATVADAGNSTVTVSGSGSESAAITLDVVDVNCTGCLGTTELGADSVSTSELNGAGVESELEGVMDLQDMQGAVIDAQVPDSITVTSASSTEGTDYGTLTDGKVCIYDLASTEIDCTASTSGVGDMLKATYDSGDNGKADSTDQVGTLTNGKGCTTDGSVINCTSTPTTGTLNTLKENNAAVGDADIVTLDFLGADFDLSESPDTEMNVVVAAAMTRDTEWDTISEINTATTDADIISTTSSWTGGDLSGTGLAATVAANSVALTTDTTGNYAAGDGEAGNALTGDSATSFFSSGTLEDAIMPASMDSKTFTTYLKIPTAASPTVDAAGKIAEDTTAGQLIYGATPRVLDPVRTACARVSDIAAADDNFNFFMANQAITVTSVGCYCDGTCTTKATFTLEDNSGNAMTITGTNPTCAATTGAATYAAVTASNGLVAGESMRFDVTNTPSPDAADEYVICFTYTIDRQ